MMRSVIIVWLAFCFTSDVYGANISGLVIDAGHSPKSPGATSCTGRLEYLYNADLARLVSAYLSDHNIPVTVTHQPNEEITLRNRARVADVKSVFLSIHHDSVQPQFISWKDHRPTSIKAEGYSIFVSSKNAYYAQSVKYARRLGETEWPSWRKNRR